MTSKAERNTGHFISIISIAITVVMAIVTFTVFSTRIDERSKDNEKSIIKQEDTNVRQWKTLNASDKKLDNIRYNLKTLMQSQGVRYQE